MEITTNINAIDILKLIIYAQNRNKMSWGLFVIVAFVFNFVSLVGVWAMDFPADETMRALLRFFGFVFTCYLFTIFFTVISTLLSPAWQKGRLGEHSFKVSEKGFTESTQFNCTKIEWSSVNSAEIKRHGLYMKHSATELFLIPRRSFSTDEEFNIFADEFLGLWDKSKRC